MKWWASFLLSSACALAHAAPGEPDYAAMDALLAERGLMSRLGHQIQAAKDSVSERASGLVINAMGFLGVPYRYGGNDMETGVDCSGFVRAVYEQSVGKLLPRRSADQAAATEAIDRSELKPGDLVFFNTMKGLSATSVFISAMANSSTLPAPAVTFASKTCGPLIGTPASTAHAGSRCKATEFPGAVGPLPIKRSKPHVAVGSTCPSRHPPADQRR
jgi:hypothetical protein